MTNRTELWQGRYGGSASKIDVDLNDCLTTLLSHRSIRAYLPKPVLPGTLEVMVALAQSASTSSNLQTCSVVAEAERKQKLSSLAGNQVYIRQCQLFLVWLADLARLTRVAESRGIAHDGLNYLEMFVTATVDAALADQNATVDALG